MEKSYARLIENNKTWVAEQLQLDPSFFENLSKGQAPEYLWIGCSDSRVPANQITNTMPGDIFVHRNIANVVVHTDMNLLSVLDYSVNVLKVKHVIVCGHYGCGGVLAAMTNRNHGLVNKWLLNIKDIYVKHKSELTLIDNLNLRADRLVELNVIEQVYNLTKTSIVQKAWKERLLNIHGWVYDMKTGRIKDMDVLKDEITDIVEIYWYE